jgi:hypothetical protein
VTDDIEHQVRDVERRIERARELARQCVAALRDADDDAVVYLIAERLPRLGSLALPELLAVMRTAEDSRRTAAALVALDVGGREKAVPILLEELSGRGPYATLAARRLGAHEIVEAAPAIHAALAATDVEEIDLAVALIDALTTLRFPLGQEEARRLGSGPWQLQEALRRGSG